VGWVCHVCGHGDGWVDGRIEGRGGGPGSGVAHRLPRRRCACCRSLLLRVGDLHLPAFPCVCVTACGAPGVA
jgi:hypothetical protein